jgi:hypothetical protein
MLIRETGKLRASSYELRAVSYHTVFSCCSTRLWIMVYVLPVSHMTLDVSQPGSEPIGYYFVFTSLGGVGAGTRLLTGGKERR